MRLKIYAILAGIIFLFSNCSDVLDRPSLTTAEDGSYWTSEDRVRLYANAFYANFFVGYGVKFETTYAPNASYTFNDDAVRMSTQGQFGRSVPTTKGSTSLDLMWQSEFTGPTWNFAWIRKANIMLDRIKGVMPNILTEEQNNHWTGIGRFFRGLEYARLVNVFGDVPYYDTEVKNTDKDALYKDRTPRNEVMDAVYDDFAFAMQNVRLTDVDAQNVNRYVVAAFVSRWALFEASWQKYYYKNNDRARKFFEQAVAAAEIVKNSGKFDIDVDFRTLFGSTAKPGKECILYRTYDADKNVTHSIASTCNMNDPTDVGPNLDLIKAFICVDGKDYQTSTVVNAGDFTLSNLIKTRDPRFEATFYNQPTPRAKSSYLYVAKFIPRSALVYLTVGGSPAANFQSEKNTTGYPVIRYAEVLLNWMEAKAELATLGGAAVTQADIDASINKIRNRPLADEVKTLVSKTAPMQLDALPADPRRDATVSPLLWEIRRERRMEFAFEFSRIIDLRRWKKLEYMDTDKNKDLLVGTWVNFNTDGDKVKAELKDDNRGKLRVMAKDGTFTVYDGTNAARMSGFYYPTQNQGRLPFLNIANVNPYLSPIGTNQIDDYRSRGYTLTQTEGWPTGLN